ncbi:MAG TPA: hypothetical protein VGL77_11435 [Armatimonadota bacterium]|jgi:mannose-6-phosphate isomerase-like protein (cupin superfamily)
MSWKIFSAGQLREMAPANADASAFRALSERYWVNLVHKDHNPKLTAEMHDTEADIYLVVEGEGDLYLGGTLLDPTTPTPGQHRGSGLDGATHHALRAGDLIIIPEGTPHMVDTRNSRLVYAVIKENVAEK